MPCTKCDHTLHAIVAESHRRVFWCPRCGTLREEVGSGPDGEARFATNTTPMLLDRVRQILQDAVKNRDDAALGPSALGFLQFMHLMGISEASFPPKQRPQV